MRLTCPNCGATYEVEPGVIPAGGSHVQCSGCHTRWFARGSEPAPLRPPRLSEDQMLERLEARAQRPRLAAVSPSVSTPATPEPAVASAPPSRDPAPPAAVESAPTPLRPRPGADRPEPAAPPAIGASRARPQPPVRRSRFGLGFCLGVGLAGLALAAYLRSEDLATAAPALAPALDAFAARVDLARDWVETTLGPLRDSWLPG